MGAIIESHLTNRSSIETEVIFNNRVVRGCGGWVGLSQLKEIHVKVKILIVRTRGLIFVFF